MSYNKTQIVIFPLLLPLKNQNLLRRNTPLKWMLYNLSTHTSNSYPLISSLSNQFPRNPPFFLGRHLWRVEAIGIVVSRDFSSSKVLSNTTLTIVSVAYLIYCQSIKELHISLSSKLGTLSNTGESKGEANIVIVRCPNQPRT